MSARRAFFSRLGSFAFCLLAFSSVPALAHGDDTLSPAGPVITLPAGVGGPFSLIDPTGRHVTDQTLLGHWALLFFGYTSCPDICPTQLQTMMSALARLPAETAEQIQPVFITIDPKRDTPDKLRDYADMFGPRLLALRGTDAETAAIIRAYRVYAAPEGAPKDSADDDQLGIDHTSFIYLIAPDGKFANAFSPTITAKQLTEALGALGNTTP